MKFVKPNLIWFPITVRNQHDEILNQVQNDVMASFKTAFFKLKNIIGILDHFPPHFILAVVLFLIIVGYWIGKLFKKKK
ncbi:hypothetical protein EZY14_011980 [Kordia sp. TARA_039_SRF]|nr:hypothetical protein EZY14_011980 [Kordia sp. TARA_039_SRF]